MNENGRSEEIEEMIVSTFRHGSPSMESRCEREREREFGVFFRVGIWVRYPSPFLSLSLSLACSFPRLGTSGGVSSFEYRDRRGQGQDAFISKE